MCRDISYAFHYRVVTGNSKVSGIKEDTWSDTLRGTELVISLILLPYTINSHPFFFFFFFLGHMEVPRLEAESELQLPAYTTATAIRDSSQFLNLHHSSWQCRILDPLSKARDRARAFMDTRRIRY